MPLKVAGGVTILPDRQRENNEERFDPMHGAVVDSLRKSSEMGLRSRFRTIHG